jgi:hypothetical protein
MLFLFFSFNTLPPETHAVFAATGAVFARGVAAGGRLRGCAADAAIADDAVGAASRVNNTTSL